MNHIFYEPKHVDNFDKYEEMLKDISRESGRMAWSSVPATAFFIVLLIIIVTIAACIFFPFASFGVTVVIFIVEGFALFVPFALYHQKAGEYMHDRCIELDREYPGICQAYEEWERRRAEESRNGA